MKLDVLSDLNKRYLFGQIQLFSFQKSTQLFSVNDWDARQNPKFERFSQKYYPCA